VGSLLAHLHDSPPYYAVACATNAIGDLHVIAKTDLRIWHTIRLADGSWPYPFGNVDEVTSSGIGENYGAFACATNAAGDLHVITTDFPQGRILHTIPLANGSWPYPFQQLPLPNIGKLDSVACATNSAGDLRVLAGLEGAWQDLAHDPARRRLLALSLWGCGSGYLKHRRDVGLRVCDQRGRRSSCSYFKRSAGQDLAHNPAG
jgi:hypothetical protein